VLLILFAAVVLDLLGFGMILPLLPFYAQSFGASEVQIGLLFASFSAAQLVSAPLLGRLSDRLGRRPVILASILLGALAYLAFAAARSFAVLLAARTASGVAAANLGIAQAYVADVTPPAERSRGMGLLGAAFGLGFIGGPALGGMLGLYGQAAVALGAAALSLVNFFLAFVWLAEPPAVQPPPGGEAGRSARWLDLGGLRRAGRPGRERTVFGLMLLFFLVTFGFAQMEATLALFCQARFGFGHVETSWLFVLVGAVMVGVQGGLVGRLAPRFGERRLIYAGIGLMAAGLLALPEAPAVAVLAGAAALLALGNGLYSPSYLALLSRLAGEGAQGGTMGLARSFGALARVFGPPAGTWLFGHLGAGWPFWAAGGLMAGSLAFGWAVLRNLAPPASAPAGPMADL
jgi:MFS family permease